MAQCCDWFGYVSSRVLWVKFKFSRVKVCIVAVYGPNEVEEREKFWNALDRVVDAVGNGNRLCALGNGLRAGISGGFGVP